MASTGTKPYLDDKAELPAQGNSHELANTERVMPILVLPTPQDPAELPASEVNPHEGAARAGGAASTIWAPHLQPPTSPGGVSDVTSADDDQENEGPTENVSPLSPIARKPVGGPSELQLPGSDAEQVTGTVTDLAITREKSAVLKKNKSKIWKMLGGGSLHDRLKPASGTQWDI